MSLSKFLTIMGALAGIVPMLPIAGLPGWVTAVAGGVAFVAGKLSQTPLKPSAPVVDKYGDAGSP